MTRQRFIILVVAALMALGITIVSNTPRANAWDYGDEEYSRVICRTCAY
jgi:hypothetical protein